MELTVAAGILLFSMCLMVFIIATAESIGTGTRSPSNDLPDDQPRREPATVPHRFGMDGPLIFLTMYAVLFSFLRAYDLDSIMYVAFAIYLTEQSRRRQTELEGSDLMKACIQRVSRAKVTVAQEVSGQIGRGMLVLLGVAADDTQADALQLAEKIAGLRIFEDAQQKMNLSLADVGGAMLVVSQFTLLADCRKGRRPSFIAAAGPELAESLYQVFVETVARQGIEVATGRFREHMEVELVNDGPVTLVIDSRTLPAR